MPGSSYFHMSLKTMTGMRGLASGPMRTIRPTEGTPVSFTTKSW